LWEESIPEVEEKVLVGSAQTGNEVILNGSLCSISVVDVQRNELVVYVDTGHELLSVRQH
jgi:hypothetical protein